MMFPDLEPSDRISFPFPPVRTVFRFWDLLIILPWAWDFRLDSPDAKCCVFVAAVCTASHFVAATLATS